MRGVGGWELGEQGGAACTGLGRKPQLCDKGRGEKCLDS